MKKVKIDIQGMRCSSCSAHIEKTVKQLEGIEQANANLISNNIIVEYDDKKIKSEKIVKAIVDAGFGATILEENKKREKNKIRELENIKAMKKRLLISIVFLVPLICITIYNMINKSTSVLLFIQFILLLPIVYINRSYFIIGYKRLIKREPNMDSLIAIGSTSAIVYGIFETAGMILTLITLGKYLETKSKRKTGEAINKLINLAPKTAIVIRNGKEIEIKLEQIKVGDIVIVKPGGSIPIDGIVLEGKSSIDQSSITGESIPVEKNIGDNVLSGTINKNGYIKIKALKVGDDTTLSQIIKLVDEASNTKAPIAKIADKVSGIFVPCVIAIALVAIIFWLIQGQSLEFALNIGISVLVISCPCALGLATPVAIIVGTGKGAENGILIKSAESLELLHSVDTVVLDKTGTITYGKPIVTDIISYIDEKELLKIVVTLEKNSEHPLAEAIIEKVKQKNINPIEIEEFSNISGRGIIGKIQNINYFAGNQALMKEKNIDITAINKESEDFLKQGKTIIYFAKQNEIIGIIAVADTVKETSKKAIEQLKNKNIEVVMITGDNKIVAETIGKELKIEKVISEVLPKEKEQAISEMQKQGKKVAFVGDGINDSPALVRADIGMAIGSGTDIAIESADVILMKNDLLDIVKAINLSKAVIKNIKMNLFWAFFYNCIGIPIAAGVFYLSIGLKLNPIIGAIAMSLSSVCVVTNALRLKKFK